MVDEDMMVAVAEEEDVFAMAINNHRQLKYMYMRMMTSLRMKIGNQLQKTTTLLTTLLLTQSLLPTKHQM